MGAVTRLRAALTSLVMAAVAACSDGHLDVFALKTASPPSSGGSSAGGASGFAGATLEAQGGAAGEGGALGESGAVGAAAGGAPSSTLLLDDFEDGDTQALVADGWWYLVNDETGTQSFGIELVTRSESMHAIRTQGAGFTDWGAILGLDLAGSDAFVDASASKVLHFFARAAQGSASELDVVLVDDVAKYWVTITMSSEFQEYSLPLADFAGEGGVKPVDASALSQLQFFVAAPNAFDYWIDDVEFGP